MLFIQASSFPSECCPLEIELSFPATFLLRNLNFLESCSNFTPMAFDPAPYRHSITFPVRFSDLDAMGHVNNASYLTYFEEGRAAWFRECVGMAVGSIDFPVIVARIAIDYLAPVSYGETVDVYHRCARIGTKSLTIEGALTVGETAAAQYECTVVYFDYDSQSTRPVPPADSKKIRKFEPALN